VNATNRALWIVVSLLLIALGTTGVLAHYGRLPGTDPDLPLLSPDTREQWNAWGDWAVAATVAAGAVLALLGLLLVRAQLRRRGRADMPNLEVRGEPAMLTPIEAGAGPAMPGTAGAGLAVGSAAGAESRAPVAGTLRVESGALRRALAVDLRHQRGIERADVRLTGDADDPHLRVWLTIDPNADLTDLRERVVGVVDRFTVTAGRHAVVDEVTVRVPNRPPARVR
jgi:hypothetical protein